MDISEITVKSQEGNQILLFYVDDNGSEKSIVTTVENVVSQPEHVGEVISLDTDSTTYEIVSNISQEELIARLNQQRESWISRDTFKLLTFYIDNKVNFRKNEATKLNLLRVACKNLFPSKTVESCEAKLNSLKNEFIELYTSNDHEKISQEKLYNLLYQAFQDLPEVRVQESYVTNTRNVLNKDESHNNIIFVEKKKQIVADAQVVKMLEMYIAHKNKFANLSKEIWQKSLWVAIAKKLGNESPEYWHKRFLNFKQNYIRILDKGTESNWPYLTYFNKIYEDDEDFKNKYLTPKPSAIINPPIVKIEAVSADTFREWEISDMTVLAKYYFDSFQDFIDKSIPNKFLWMEVGRLLNREPESCEIKYYEMKELHIENLVNNSIDINQRIPLAIILDNIISREVAMELKTCVSVKEELWNTEEIDEMVKYLFEKVDMLNDPICYNVCWACVSVKLSRSISSCKKQWDSLISLYDSILNDKKENPDMEIDWRYIELFDRICDYGTNRKLINGYVKNVANNQSETKKNKSRYEITQTSNDEEYFSEEEDTILNRRNGNGDEKAFKILEYYLKNKDLFTSKNRLRLATWTKVAKEINMTPGQCAHRFRNLKQVYISYLTRECKCPEKPIMWPYYALCKKVFGYRAIKSKILKKKSSDFNFKEWSTKEIKTLIEFVRQNFDLIECDVQNLSSWTELSGQIGKDEDMCKEKYLDLKKSYKKLKAMLTKNPNTKITWKYFSAFDNMLANEVDHSVVDMETLEQSGYEYMAVDDDIKQEIQENEDIQCIIVIPEGQDIEDVLMNPNNFIRVTENGEILETNISDTTSESKPTKVNTKSNNKRILQNYLNYINQHEGEIINSKAMWKEISNKSGKSPIYCKKMFLKLKRKRLQKKAEGEAKDDLLEKILSLKPKFEKSTSNKKTIQNDVELDNDKVKTILDYYLENLEQFLSPRFDKKSVWTELANLVEEPVRAVYNKVNDLKNLYMKNHETDSEEIPFKPILKEIFVKQEQLKETIAIDKEYIKLDQESAENEIEVEWKDSEVQQLLIWYLMNLEKFKNTKFVRTYLWKNAAEVLNKSPLHCSNKMTEIRTEYRNKVRDEPEELQNWIFYDLCQKIYGTGKKSNNYEDESMSIDMPVDMPAL